jgi:hypothetical protein
VKSGFRPVLCSLGHSSADHEFVKKIKIAFGARNPLRGNAPNKFNQWLLYGDHSEQRAEFYTKKRIRT